MRTGPPQDKSLVIDLEHKSLGDLQKQARRLGVDGWAGMTRSQLIRRIKESNG